MLESKLKSKTEIEIPVESLEIIDSVRENFPYFTDTEIFLYLLQIGLKAKKEKHDIMSKETIERIKKSAE